jgi:hypothetical protein
MTASPRLTLATLRREAKKLGAYVEDSGFDYQVGAPPGKVWSCSGDIHWLVVTWEDEGDPDEIARNKEEAIRDAIDRMSAGVEDCQIPDCDVCHGEDESDG